MLMTRFKSLGIFAGLGAALTASSIFAQESGRPRLLRPVVHSTQESIPSTTPGQPPVAWYQDSPPVEGMTYTEQLAPMAEQPEMPAFGGPLMSRGKLTGDWGGYRSSLAEKGVTFDLSTRQYFLSDPIGGLNETSRYGGRADYIINIDAQKAGFGKGTFISLHGETLYGQSIGRDVGSLLSPSLMQSLPKPNDDVTALTGVKVTQFFSENFAIFGGKINTLDDFKMPFTGASIADGFLNTGLLFNPVLARTIPYSTFGAGAVILSEKEPVFTFSVFDTNNTPTVSGFDTFFDNGATFFGQATLPVEIDGRKGHHSLGGTYSTGTYNNLQPTAYLDPVTGLVVLPNFSTGSWCTYYAFDQALVNVDGDPRRAWGLFGNIGLADNDPSPVRWFANIGIGGFSPICSRPLDTFGLGYFYAGVGDNLKQLAPNLLPINDEQGFEGFYNIAFTPWFHLTSDIQVVMPARERADTALILGLRAKIDF